MNSQETQVINDTIALFVGKEFMFTAFDVTKSVRKLGLHVLHQDVKKLVHGYQYPSNYTKKNVDVVRIVFGNVSKDSSKPILYFPSDKDVNDYTPIDVSDATPSKPVFQPQPTLNSTNPPNVFFLQFDNRGRFCMKAKMVSEAGMVPRDVAFVKIEKDSIQVSKKNPGISDSRITIDGYKNFLIFRSYFEKAFGIVPNRILVETSNGTLIVKKYD